MNTAYNSPWVVKEKEPSGDMEGAKIVYRASSFPRACSESRCMNKRAGTADRYFVVPADPWLYDRNKGKKALK